jgi:hypothetical protein
MSEGSGIALPKCAADYIDLVAKKVRYRRKVRAEVCREMFDHFADALRLAIISRVIVAVGALTCLHENTEKNKILSRRFVRYTVRTEGTFAIHTYSLTPMSPRCIAAGW